MQQLIKIGSLVLVALALAISRRAEAQSAPSWYNSWHCTGSQFERCKSAMGATSGTHGPHTSASACEAWGSMRPVEYYCYSLGGTPSSGGSGSGGSSGGASPDTPRRNPIVGPPKVVVGIFGFRGAVLGALIGSVGKDVNGKSHWAAGSLVGGGSLTAFALLGESPRLSPITKVVGSAFAGAAIGAGLGLVGDGKIIKGSPQDLATKSEVGTQAAIGAGAGVLVGLLESAAFRQQRLRVFPRSRGMLGANGRVSMLQRGSSLGVLVRW